MPNNRALIVDAAIMRSPQVLDKGLPIPGLAGSYVVDAGWCAVITEGGMFREILGPGQHSLARFSYFRDVKAISVNTRLQHLDLKTVGEFTISRPVPVQINLDLAVEYRVADARRVALEIQSPLTSLYDRTLQAVRSVVAYATVEEIRTQGEGIASATLQRLQAMQLAAVLGLEVLNVAVTTIKATDTTGDVLATQSLKEFTTLRDWQIDSAMTQQSRVTWEWLLIHRPEIAQQLITTHGVLAKEMIDRGLLDPSGFLNQPAGGGMPANPASLLGSLGVPGLPAGSFTQSGLAPATGSPAAQLPAAGNVHSRMSEEVDLLRAMPGAAVETRPGTDARGIPDGSYDVRFSAPRISGGQFVVYFSCPAGYPQSAPVVSVEVDGQELPFRSSVVAHWLSQYLVEIAREVKQYVG